MTYNGLLVKDGIIGDGVRFERIRRITGYLVGTLDRFNNGKAAEEKDRVKHCKMEDFNERHTPWTPEGRDAMAARGL